MSDFTYEPHPNLGYNVFHQHVFIGSVQKRDDGRWYARHDFKIEPTSWRTRVAAAAELLRLTIVANPS